MDRRFESVAPFKEGELANAHRVGLAVIANDSNVPEQGVILGLFQGRGANARLLGIRGMTQEQARGLALSLLAMADHARNGTVPRELSDGKEPR